MDFIKKLPLSLAFTAILVVVDRLSKQAIFIPTDDKFNAPELAKLFVTHVFSKHGVPSHVTSDRGSEFVSHFFRSLGTALDMWLHFTSGFHPEGDGQTECVNQTLEQYLRVYCNYQQDNWSDLLPLAEFAYNNAPSETTSVSPFYANKGYHPALEVYPERDLASARAHDYGVDLQALHEELKLSMTEAQKRYQRGADQRRNPPPDFKIGDKVFVRSQFICTTCPSKKLADKFLGPFKTIAHPGAVSFTLQLPDSMQGIHPVFHVSILEPQHHNPFLGHDQPPPPPVDVDGKMEFEIKEILDSKVDRRCKDRIRYL